MVRTKDMIIDAILDYFKNNKDIFNRCIEELDSYDGYLGDDRYCPMYELEEIYSCDDVMNLLQRAFFGYDEDSCILNSSGEKEYIGSFNPNRDYFKFNGYGNLVSANYIDYSDFMDKYAVESMLENRQYVYTIDEDNTLSELFDALENAE